MLDSHERTAINALVARVCDVFRPHVALDDGLPLALSILFVRFLSETNNANVSDASTWIVPDESRFDTLYRATHQGHIATVISSAFNALERSNPSLRGVFLDLRLAGTFLGNDQQKNLLLQRLLDAFADPVLSRFCTSEALTHVFGLTSDLLVSQSLGSSFQHGSGNHFTALDLSSLVIHLMDPQSSESVFDPCSGSGGLLIAAARHSRRNGEKLPCALYGQEINGQVWGISKLNLMLHGESAAHIALGDTLFSPMYASEGYELQQFDVLVANPPMNIRDWGRDKALNDPYCRFERGVPSRVGDYAFISHMITAMDPKVGRIAVVVSQGVLFRSGTDGEIRKRLVEDNLVDAVIMLPPKMLHTSSMQIAVLILRAGKTDRNVNFIDASDRFEYGKIKNALRPADIQSICKTYRERKGNGQRSRLVGTDEIKANDYQLSVTRYLRYEDQDNSTDLQKIRAERLEIQIELEELQTKLAELAKEIQC